MSSLWEKHTLFRVGKTCPKYPMFRHHNSQGPGTPAYIVMSLVGIPTYITMLLQGQVENRIVIDILRDALFEESKSYNVKYSRYFNPVSINLLALMFMMVGPAATTV